jgi:hypothetical protein
VAANLRQRPRRRNETRVASDSRIVSSNKRKHYGAKRLPPNANYKSTQETSSAALRVRRSGGCDPVARRDAICLGTPGLYKALIFARTPATEVYPSERPETLIREDESFSHRVRTVGRIVIERTLLVGPVDVQTGKVYYPNSPAMIANGLEAPLYDHAEARADPPTKAAGTRTYFETAPPTPDLLPTKPSPRSATDSFEAAPTSARARV